MAILNFTLVSILAILIVGLLDKTTSTPVVIVDDIQKDVNYLEKGVDTEEKNVEGTETKVGKDLSGEIKNLEGVVNPAPDTIVDDLKGVETGLFGTVDKVEGTENKAEKDIQPAINEIVGDIDKIGKAVESNPPASADAEAKTNKIR